MRFLAGMDALIISLSSNVVFISPLCLARTICLAIFCANCGKKLSDVFTAKYCVACGAELDDDADFCSNCGYKVHEEKVDNDITDEKTFSNESSIDEETQEKFENADENSADVDRTPKINENFSLISSSIPHSFFATVNIPPPRIPAETSPIEILSDIHPNTLVILSQIPVSTLEIP